MCNGLHTSVCGKVAYLALCNGDAEEKGRFVLTAGTLVIIIVLHLSGPKPPRKMKKPQPEF